MDHKYGIFAYWLEEYLSYRSQLSQFGPGSNRDFCLKQMQAAAEEMNAMTRRLPAS